MATKATWLFNGGDVSSAAGGKVYGFSETWYTSLEGDALLGAMDIVSAVRRLCLAKETSIVGYRIGQANGRSFVIRRFFAAPRDNDEGNLPVDSALVQVGVAGSASRKRFFVHDLPDDWIAGGVISPARRRLIRDVCDAYVAQTFQVRFQNQAAQTANVLSIDALGVVTTQQAFPVAVGSVVQLLNVRDNNGRAVRGNFVVSVGGAGTTFTLAQWPGKVVPRSGKVRLQAFLFGAALSLPDDQKIIGAASRKVGRPFFQSVGRVRARR